MSENLHVSVHRIHFSISWPHMPCVVFVIAGAHFFWLCSDRWDWRTVMEDEYMFVDVETGELIHPIHYEARQANS